MKIVVVGTGYVGLVSGTCFAEMGVDVTCVDVDKTKIEGLKNGIIPIYEPGLDDLVAKNINAGRLSFTSDLKESLNGAEVVFCAVGTPSDKDGTADLKHIIEAARTIGECIESYLIVVIKSTVPVGTSLKVKQTIEAELSSRGVEIPFDVASNPEFLKEGAAVNDFMFPDRVVVGVESERAEAIMRRLYKPFMLSVDRILVTNIPSAEMIKYAANSMLATRISFMNDIANLCEIIGADVNIVRKGIGSDTRIGKKFLYPGCGYGGSCFPKDVRALIKSAESQGYSMRVLKAVEEVNESQKEVLYNKLKRHFNGELRGRKIAIWGVSFKPDTDDIREAPSLVLIESLLSAGATVSIYDPIAMEEARCKLGESVSYAKDMYKAAEGADALVLITEWKEFRLPNWNTLKQTMNNLLLVDGRNIYDKNEVIEEGFEYYGIGN